MAGICFCASGCALSPMTDPGAFGDDCRCWCHAGQRDRQQDKDGAR